MSFQFISCKIARCAAWAALFLCLVTFLQPLRAQVAGGTLSGTIADDAGVGIPKAQVEAKNTATGIYRTVPTNDDGYYTIVNLLPGDYDLTITANGFNTEIKKGLTITVGDHRTMDVNLRVGNAVKTTIVVTEQAPDVQLTNAEISDVV